MRKLIYLAVLFFIVSAANPKMLQAFIWGNKELVTINDQTYSPEDFEHWWENWKEEDTPFPDNLEKFIEWQLMAQEASDMELETTPGYRKKVDVFLKARSFILLKEEEVLSKINVSDSEILDLYKSEYLPIWKLNILFLKDEGDASAAYDALISGRENFEDIVEKGDLEKGTVSQINRIFRPIAFETKQNWLEKITKLEKGKVAPVFQDRDRFVIIKMEDITVNDQSDFEKIKDLIKQKIFKQKQEELTLEFVAKLRKKYEVEVNEEIFEKLGEENFPEELLDEPLITTNHTDLPARIISQQLKKEEKLRTREPFTPEKKKEVKQQLVDGLIAQVVLGWESLERHYEEKPPFKWVFEFYTKNRLKIALENRLYSEIPEVDDAQIASYYQENIQSFTKPEVVKVGSVTTDLKTAKKIWLSTLQGKDFFNVVEKDFSLGVKIQEIPIKHLAPELQEEIKRMAIGDVSSPVAVNEEGSIIKLIDRREKQTVPLDQVKGKIRQKLTKEKFLQIRAELMQKLKEHSTISINQEKWEAIHKENRGKNEI